MLPRDLQADEVIPFAQKAETLGFDEIWVAEDLAFRGGIAQVATVLATTSRITVGVGILPAAVRNAAFTAMEVATLAQLHPHRLIVGIGHGMPDWLRSVAAWPSSPLTLLKEYAGAVAALLRGDPGPAAGRYVNVEGLILKELPEAVPPILLGVRGPRSMVVAGEVADGVVLAEPATPTYIAASAALVRSGRGSDAPPHIVSYDLAAVADDRDSALETVRPALAVVGAPDWRPHLAGLPFADDLAALASRTGNLEHFAAQLPSAWIADLALAGTPAEVSAKIALRHEAGAGSVILIPVAADRTDSLSSLSRVLAP